MSHNTFPPAGGRVHDGKKKRKVRGCSGLRHRSSRIDKNADTEVPIVGALGARSNIPGQMFLLPLHAQRTASSARCG